MLNNLMFVVCNWQEWLKSTTNSKTNTAIVIPEVVGVVVVVVVFQKLTLWYIFHFYHFYSLFSKAFCLSQIKYFYTIKNNVSLNRNGYNNKKTHCLGPNNVPIFVNNFTLCEIQYIQIFTQLIILQFYLRNYKTEIKNENYSLN